MNSHLTKTTKLIIQTCSCSIRRNVSKLSLYRPKKEKYPLQYKVRVVNQDGSSYITRYHLPVGVIRLPLDPNTLTEEEKKARLRRIRSEKKIDVQEYKEDVKFDRKVMMELMKKKKL